MFGSYFYHERIRKSVAIFGRLFNNIYVIRKNSSGGVLNQLKVPLAYAPRAKYLERIRENNSLEKRQKFYSPVPYNLGFSLSIYAKSQDDALQILEQIIPSFNPQYIKIGSFEPCVRLHQCFNSLLCGWISHLVELIEL